MEQESDIIRIDIKEFFKVLKKEKWIILAIITLFTALGAFYAFSLKEEFVSEGKILPEASGKNSGLGQYAGLAALAGIDLGSSSGGVDAIRPDLYPDVLKSTDFFLQLLTEKFNDKKNKEWVFSEYYLKEIIDGKIKKEDQKLNFPKSKNYIALNRQTEKNISDLKKRIICSYDKKTGVIGISVKMPDPVIAANIASFSMKYLTDYIINYRTEKQKRDLDFLAERLSSAKGKYYNTQSKKATYTDQMPLGALRLQSADLQRERIESEYKISSSFYNTLLQKYEEAKLQMQQETPVIQVLEPPIVPNLKSEPKKAIIIALFLFAGMLISVLTSALIKKNYSKFIYN
ncbi:Wzz/FepE/Etk N-terminal domain-containing protein [Lacihabitans lacunae]|uniref:Wzz/FepE/Etk N-terminal domain-containing protein n=1 Tax=Lacihabitans lacunae TaxID=1028214 RepID=A0ABV7Z120_9BACT